MTKGVIKVAPWSNEKARQGVDFICDGVADEVEIQAAIDAALKQKKDVQLESDTYNLFDCVKVGNVNVTGVTKQKFVITLEQDEDGYIIVSCPALPGCYSQGRTREEAIANIREAILGYIASMRKHGEPIPVTDVEEVEVVV